MKATDIVAGLPALVKTNVTLRTSEEVAAKKEASVVVLYSINAHSLAEVQEKASRRDIVDLQNRFRDNLESEEAIKWREQLPTVADLRNERPELENVPTSLNNVKVVTVDWSLDVSKWFDRPQTASEIEAEIALLQAKLKAAKEKK